MKKRLIIIACYLNRRLRFGNSKNRIFQFLVIRSRTYLKKYIQANLNIINQLGYVEVKLKYAGKMELITNDYIDRWLFMGDDFEPSTVRLIKKYLKENDNFLDLGANIGFFSLIGARQIGKGGSVYAFEPTPLTISRFKKNVTLNRLGNIKLIEKVVSNKSGLVNFKTPNGKIRNSGRSSMRCLEEGYSELIVETITIDSLLDELKKIALIKMDIEGAEGLALEGMQGLIGRDKPVIIMELSNNFLTQLGHSSEQVLNFLRNQQYQIYKISEQLQEIDENATFNEFQFNILCIPRPSTV